MAELDPQHEQAVEIALLRRDLEALQADVKELNKEIKFWCLPGIRPLV